MKIVLKSKGNGTSLFWRVKANSYISINKNDTKSIYKKVDNTTILNMLTGNVMEIKDKNLKVYRPDVSTDFGDKFTKAEYAKLPAGSIFGVPNYFWSGRRFFMKISDYTVYNFEKNCISAGLNGNPIPAQVDYCNSAHLIIWYEE